MKKLVVIALGVVLAASSYANALDDYLKVRKASKIVGTTRSQVLDALVGTKSVEISGDVKGVISVGEGASILLTMEDGSTQYVHAASAPDWLNGNEIQVRMIVKARREGENGDLKTDLVAVIPETDMDAWEAKFAKKATPAKSVGGKVAKSSSSFSGTIGPRGSRLNSGSSKTARSGASSSRTGRNWVVPASEATPLYAQFAKNQNPRLSDKEAYRIAEGVIGFSLHYGVDARLIMAMIIAESSFNPRDTSHTGAMGLVQLMPDTARELGVRNPYDPVDNLSGAVKLISQHIDKYTAQTGDDFEALCLALAAYNAGPGAVKKAGGIPAYRETQNYVKKVIQFYSQICGG